MQIVPICGSNLRFRTVYVQLYLRRARSDFKRDFRKFLIIAMRSTIENAKVMLVLEERRLISEPITTVLLPRLEPLCRKTTNCQKSYVTDANDQCIAQSATGPYQPVVKVEYGVNH